MNTNAALARVEEAYTAVNAMLRTAPKGPEAHLAKRAKKHLRAALCDLILCQEIPVVRPRRLLVCKN
jgi:hypothetical protein